MILVFEKQEALAVRLTGLDRRLDTMDISDHLDFNMIGIHVSQHECIAAHKIQLGILHPSLA